MSLLPYLHFFCLITYAYLAGYILYKDPKSLLNKTCAVLLAFFSIWNFADVFSSGKDIAEDTALLFQNISSIGWIGFASVLLCFSLAFSKKERLCRSIYFLFIILFLPLFFIYKQWTNCITIDPVRQAYGWSYAFTDTIWTYLFYTYYISFTLLAIYFIYRHGKKTNKIPEKRSAKLIIVTICISLTGGTIFDVALPELGIYTIPPLANIFILFFAAGLVYAIAKHRLLTITPSVATENIISTMTELLIISDNNGNILNINNAVSELLKYEQSELTGTSYKRLFRHDKIHYSIFERISRGEIIKNISCVFLTKDAKEIPVCFSCSFLKDINSEIRGYVFIAGNITESMLARKELKESEKRYREIFNNSVEGIYQITLEGRCRTVNPAFARMFGYKSPEEMKTTISDVGGQLYVNPEDRERLIEQMSKSEGKIRNFEAQMKRKDGSLFWASISAVIQISRENEILIEGTCMDITERKQAEIAVIESEEKFRNLTEFLPTIISEIDLHGNFTYVNKSGYSLTGYSEEDVKNGLNIKDIIVSEQRELAFENLSNILKGKEIGLNEYTLRKINGDHFPVYIKTMVICSEGKPVGFRCIVLDISEQKEAQKKLKESEEKFSTAFMISPYAISITDARDGKFLEVNDNFISISGYTRDEIMADSSIGLGLWVNIEDRNQVVSELMKGIEVKGREYRFRKRNGEILIGLFSAQVVFLNNKSYILSSINDVTDSVRAKEALCESENYLNTILNFVQTSIMLVDAETHNIVDVNSMFSNTFGAGKDNIIGLNCHKLICPAEKGNCPITDLGQDINNSECVMIKSNKEELFVLKTVIPITLNNRKLLLESITDISEWKKTRDALLESEKKYRLLADNSADVIFILDMNLKYKYVSPSVEKLRGVSHEKALNESIEETLTPDSLQVALMAIREELEREKIPEADPERSRVLELKMLCSDNSEIWTEVKASFLRDNNEIVGIIGTTRDISERKRSEIQLKEKAEEIEKQNEEYRTLNEELIASKEKAEESDLLKSAFLANISHEIRTPMNGILGFAELLTEPGLSGEKQKEYLKIIESSGKRMLGIINDVVDISKIESGQMEVRISPTNINEQIQYLQIFFKPEVVKKGLQISFKNSLPDKEAIIKTDKEKVYAIMTNLIKNAIKFTRSGSIEMGYEKKGEYLEFFVKDTGIGIRDDLKEKIFERFRQGSMSVSGNYEGTGLGLSISKAYVEVLGGKMWVESGLGKGTVFYFTIPYLVPEVVKTEADKTVSGNGEKRKNNKLKILIAEDEETSAKLISVFVGDFSREVLFAHNGVEAVEACRNNPDIDLILMDVKMPEMNGYEATRQIRLFNRDVVIIAQTAFAFSGENEKAKEAGCNDYISKPIEGKKLRQMIRKHFK